MDEKVVVATNYPLTVGIVIGSTFLIVGVIVMYIFFIRRHSDTDNGAEPTNEQVKVQEDDSIRTTSDVDSSSIVADDNYAPVKQQPQKEVFNVGSNIFTYDEAKSVCKAFGGTLATYEQLRNAHDKGANWCNYGWSAGKLALYPTQHSAWKAMQTGPRRDRTSCGLPGINGGSFPITARFGANCYGVKPTERDIDKLYAQQEMSRASRPFNRSKGDKQVQYFESVRDQLVILPFHEQQWSTTNGSKKT